MEDEDEVMTVEEDAPADEGKKTAPETDKEKPKVDAVEEDREEEEEAPAASGDDERVGHDEGEETETSEQRRERRRLERRKKVERNKRDRVELQFLRKRNESLERRFSDAGDRLASLEDATIDQRITGVKGQIDVADQVIAKAIEKQSGTDVVEATRIRDTLKDSLRELESLKDENLSRYETEKEETKSPQVHPQIGDIRKRASEWVGRNKWFDPKLGNQESMVARAVEQAVANEGFDPTSKDYWDELDDRLKEVLPHRFKKKADTRVNDDEDDEDEEEERPEPRRANGNGKKPSGGPRLSSGGRERPLRSNEVYINADRKAAMQEAGVWDDPVLRNRYLSSYRAYDKEHGAKRR